MKAFLLLILLTLSAYAGGAQTERQYRLIDRRARVTGFYPLKELAAKLTAPYTKEEDKVRSIFVWITAHIHYDLEQSRLPDSIRSKAYLPFIDSCEIPGERWTTAWAVAALQQKKAICAGYAALFKRLCDEVGLQAVVINGCARNYKDIGGPYQPNHAWNAVMIGGEWKLLDATWGGSSFLEDENKIVQEFKPFYYCTPPEALILNHCPDDPKWTLMTNPPGHQEFAANPYLDQNSLRILQSFLPRKGMLERRVGDSATFRIKTRENCKKIAIYETKTKKWIAYIPAPDSFPLEQFVALEPDVANTILARAYAVSGGTGDKNAPDSAQKDETLFFTQSEGQLRFVYPVRYKGSQIIEIYVDRKRVLAYRINGK